MSDIKIDLTLKDLDVQTAAVIIKYLGGESPAAMQRGKPNEVAEAKVTKADLEAKADAKAPKSEKKAKAAKVKPEPEPEEDEDDWDDGDKEDDAGGSDSSKYASIKKWRELATVLVGDGYYTAPKLLAKCREISGSCPALDKIPEDNLITRCERTIVVLGA